jgi:hypothetical protein
MMGLSAIRTRMRDPGLVATPAVDAATVRVLFEYVGCATVWLLVGTGIELIASMHGLSGKAIGGVTYGSAMPAFADQLTDEEVAAVLSYERTSWGNQAKPVKPDEVVARRK